MQHLLAGQQGCKAVNNHQNSVWEGNECPNIHIIIINNMFFARFQVIN